MFVNAHAWVSTESCNQFMAPQPSLCIHNLNFAFLTTSEEWGLKPKLCTWNELDNLIDFVGLPLSFSPKNFGIGFVGLFYHLAKKWGKNRKKKVKKRRERKEDRHVFYTNIDYGKKIKDALKALI